MFLINQAQMEMMDDYCDKQFESRLTLFLEHNCAAQLKHLIAAEPDIETSSDVTEFLLKIAKEEGCETEMEFAVFCCLRLLIFSEAGSSNDLDESGRSQCEPEFQDWFRTLIKNHELPMELRCELVMERVCELSQHEKVYQHIEGVLAQLSEEF